MQKFSPIIKKAPHMLHGADYNPEQWIQDKDTIWPADMQFAKEANMNSLSIGMFSWAMLEPAEGEFQFEWMDEIMDHMAENGITAVLSTPSASRPNWLAEKYPEVLRVGADRVRNLYGERHNHCMSSLAYKEKVTIINTKLAERYKDHPALGIWHISNEYNGECHCALCQESFREYLKQQYGTLDAVNDAWWATFWSHRYTEWSQIASPSPYGERSTHGLNLDWKRFTTEQFVRFYELEIAPLKKNTPHVPCTTNLMAGYDGLDYMRLAEVMDVVSWDSYPDWHATAPYDVSLATEIGFRHDLMYGLLRKPFMLMESCPSATNWMPTAKLLRPGVHALQSIQAVAHGSDTVQYFQFRKSRGSSEKFHGAVIDHEGSTNTRVFREIAALGAKLKTMDAIVGTAKPSKVALIYDYQVDWALSDIQGGLQKGNDYRGTVIAHYGAFWRMGISIDIIDQTRDFSDYDLVVAPMAYMLRDGYAERVSAYVAAGGNYVASYFTGYVGNTDLTFLGGFPGPLRDVLGIWAEELDALYPDDRNGIVWNGTTYEAFGLCELIHAESATVLGTYASDFYQGSPALTANEFGQGNAYHIAARTGDDFLDAFYSSLVDEIGIPRVIAEALPKGVSLQVRADGDTLHSFFMNFTPETKAFTANGMPLSLAPWEYRLLTL